MNVDYIGWNDDSNFGDYTCKEIIERLGFKHKSNAKRALIGAGTLFPLSFVRKKFKEELKKELIVFGTGCDDDKFINKEDWAKRAIDNDLYTSLEEYKSNLEFTKKILKNAKFIGVRDEFTRKTLGMGECIGDPFYSVKSYPKIEQKDPYMVLNLGRGGFNVWGGIDGEYDTRKNLLKFVKNFVMKKMGYKVVVIPYAKNDLLFADTAIRYLGAGCIKTFKASNVFHVFNNADFTITYKLHGLITALTVNTPTIPIEYRPKVNHMAKDFKIDNYVLKTDNVTEKTLEEKFNLLKDWDYEYIFKKKYEYATKQKNFIGRVKKYYNED